RNARRPGKYAAKVKHLAQTTRVANRRGRKKRSGLWRFCRTSGLGHLDESGSQIRRRLQRMREKHAAVPVARGQVHAVGVEAGCSPAVARSFREMMRVDGDGVEVVAVHMVERAL